MSDVEKAVIGSVLLDSNVLTLLDGLLTSNDFGDGQLALLWDGIQGMRSRREPVDVLTVGAALPGWGVRSVTPADLHTFVSLCLMQCRCVSTLVEFVRMRCVGRLDRLPRTCWPRLTLTPV